MEVDKQLAPSGKDAQLRVPGWVKTNLENDKKLPAPTFIKGPDATENDAGKRSVSPPRNTVTSDYSTRSKTAPITGTIRSNGPPNKATPVPTRTAPRSAFNNNNTINKAPETNYLTLKTTSSAPTLTKTSGPPNRAPPSTPDKTINKNPDYNSPPTHAPPVPPSKQSITTSFSADSNKRKTQAINHNFVPSSGISTNTVTLRPPRPKRDFDIKNETASSKYQTMGLKNIQTVSSSPTVMTQNNNATIKEVTFSSAPATSIPPSTNHPSTAASTTTTNRGLDPSAFGNSRKTSRPALSEVTYTSSTMEDSEDSRARTNSLMTFKQLASKNTRKRIPRQVETTTSGHKGPSSKSPIKAIALCDFQTNDPEELSFRKGDQILVKDIDSSQDPWGRGVRVLDQTEGWFPLTAIRTEDSSVSLIPKAAPNVDRSSIILNKPQTSSALENKLMLRPDVQKLENNNIIKSGENHTEEKKKKKDTLHNFVRRIQKKSEKIPAVELSKMELTFENKPIGFDDVVYDQFTMKNTGNCKLPWSIQVEEYSLPLTMTFTPPNGILAKGKSQVVKVKLQLRTLVTVDAAINIIVRGQKLKVFTAKIISQKTLFGVDPTTLEHVDDEGLRIPAVLQKLKNSLLKFDAYSKEGIFRISGNQSSVLDLRKKVDGGTFDESNDHHAVASLLKIWFRELPSPLLQTLSREDVVFDERYPESCVEKVESILANDQEKLTLLRWLVRQLQACAKFTRENKMSPENLAIVVGPNMIKVTKEMDAISGLVWSQRVIKFFGQLIMFMNVNGGVSKPISKAANSPGIKPVIPIPTSAPPPIPIPSTQNVSESNGIGFNRRQPMTIAQRDYQTAMTDLGKMSDRSFLDFENARRHRRSKSLTQVEGLAEKQGLTSPKLRQDPPTQRTNGAPRQQSPYMVSSEQLPLSQSETIGDR